MRRILTPLTSPSTYLRWTCLILGGALAMPYVMVGTVVSGLLGLPEAQSYTLVSAQPVVFAGVLPLIALTGLFLPVRALELTAARGLLDARIDSGPDRRARTWAERRRTAAWFTLHLGIGAVLAGATLALVPFVVWLCLLPLLGDRLGFFGTALEAGWSSAWGPAAAVATSVLLVHAVAGAGALLARLAPVLLGPTPADRLAALEERTRRLATRNRLARELHDSVGHALSLVTIQAGAAGRVLDRDPEAARAALAVIEESARSALEDLDHVLGVLREEESGGRAPARTLTDLPELVRSTGAVAEVTGDLSALPALVSREAYRIVQEALTNAIRHGCGTARLAAAVCDDHLELEVRNQIRQRSGRSGGRGVAGMRERVTLLGGHLDAGAADGEWRVAARLPLRGAQEPVRHSLRGS
ncbi:MULTISPECIES: sensor histidine kinase [Streptosporangium]|uniref:histidine kinase n=1 Tax=Streptosporangium brasiliense TaxID=47480 RepID=A0ABT9RFC9_9ACTN|nr:histidine kinase [Streptosporangium brasiliense]MDP9867959.1 signal transduction histidine kinase [Streptosporangium brasiliense]